MLTVVVVAVRANSDAANPENVGLWLAGFLDVPWKRWDTATGTIGRVFMYADLRWLRKVGSSRQLWCGRVPGQLKRTITKCINACPLMG